MTEEDLVYECCLHKAASDYRCCPEHEGLIIRRECCADCVPESDCMEEAENEKGEPQGYYNRHCCHYLDNWEREP